MAFTSLGTILPQRLRQAGVSQGVEAAQILAIANQSLVKVFGEGIFPDHARAVAYRCKRLQISTMNASLRQELNLRQQEILSLVNRAMGKDCVNKIQVIL